MMGLLALGTGEELAAIEPDFSMMDEGKNGAIVHNAPGIPSSIHLKEFLKEHHLNIDPKAFKNSDGMNPDITPLSTPAAGRMASTRLHQKPSNSVA